MSTPDPIPSLPVSELDVELIKTRRSNGDLHSREDYGGMDPYWHLGACIDALVVEVERLRALVPLPATPTEGRLLSALKSVTEHMDRAGGDGYGMPECPWCRSQLSDDHHNSDCELAAARELLAEIDRLRALVPLPATPTEDRYYALRDAVTMYAGDGIISDDAVINEAQEHATIAQCCICKVSDNRTERGTPQLRTVPLLSLQRLEWVYPYGSEEPYVRIADLDKISRLPVQDEAAPQMCVTCGHDLATHDAGHSQSGEN